jgi:hypothetical protein
LSTDLGECHQDGLKYEGNLANFDAFKGDLRHVFVRGDINDYALVTKLPAEYKSRAVLNFAAELKESMPVILNKSLICSVTLCRKTTANLSRMCCVGHITKPNKRKASLCASPRGVGLMWRLIFLKAHPSCANGLA